MVDTPTKEAKALSFGFSAGPEYQRLIDALAIATQKLNRSLVVRIALIDMADRLLASDWREELRFEQDGEAA